VNAFDQGHPMPIKSLPVEKVIPYLREAEVLLAQRPSSDDFESDVTNQAGKNRFAVWFRFRLRRGFVVGLSASQSHNRPNMGAQRS